MRLNRLDLNQLMILDMLLEERSPSKVAARLHVSQPAVSASLRNLRTFFNDPLFVASGRKMTPTPFAESLAKPTRDILLNAEGLTRMRPSTQVSTYQRTIRIAASDFIATVMLAPILAEAPREAPLLSFEVVSVFSSRHHYHEDLDRGDVDMLVIPETFASASHRMEGLLDERYVCIACKTNRIAARSFDLETYVSAGHVGIADNTMVGHPYDELHLQRLKVKRRMEVTVPSLLWIPAMIVNTARIATIHATLASELTRRWPLKILPCPAEVPPLREVIQWHRYQDHDPGLIWLRKKLVEQAGKVYKKERSQI